MFNMTIAVNDTSRVPFANRVIYNLGCVGREHVVVTTNFLSLRELAAFPTRRVNDLRLGTGCVVGLILGLFNDVINDTAVTTGLCEFPVNGKFEVAKLLDG